MTKTDNGVEFPSEAYAYVPDPAEPSTWKIRLWASPEEKETRAQLGAAAAAMSPGGFRGEKAGIPAADVAHVKAKIRAGYTKLGVKPDEIPDSIAASEGLRLFLVPLGDLVAGSDENPDKPVRIPLAMIGTFHKGKQKFSITRADVATMAANFQKDGKGEVVLDYEHASADPDVALGGPVPAAGWIVSIDDKPDASGVVWGSVNFTQKARDLVAAREYKYVSPFLVWGARDKSTGEPQGLTLMCAALTNTPVLDRMPAIQLSEAGWTKSEGDEQTMSKEKVMCSEHPRTPLLCPTCDKDEMQSLVSASDHTRRIGLSEMTRDGEGRLNIATVPAGAFVAIEVVRAMETERTALSEVAAAVEKGKIAPAQRAHFTKLALSDIETFREIVKPMQAVDLTEHGVAGTGAEKGAKGELNQINIQLSERAEAISKEKKLPYADAYKMAGRERPELIKRRNVLTSQAQAGARGGDEE